LRKFIVARSRFAVPLREDSVPPVRIRTKAKNPDYRKFAIAVRPDAP